jgi:3-methyladenine DNA glycosylase AlkD
MRANNIIKKLKSLSDKNSAAQSKRYFKTNLGEYGYNDRFLGIKVPTIRKIASEYLEISDDEIVKLLNSRYHEIRYCGVIILVNKYLNSNDKIFRKKLFNLYLNQINLGNINNWDLIDISAPTFGLYLIDRKDSKKILFALANSSNLWERRASVLLTFAYLKKLEINPTLIICKKLLYDKEDLIQKAVGWSLREVGKINKDILNEFLAEHISKISRTSLRYAIEKFSPSERQYWLNK